MREANGRRQGLHHVSHALNPNFVGSVQVRDMDLAVDGTLTLSTTDKQPGTTVDRLHRLVWARGNPSPTL